MSWWARWKEDDKEYVIVYDLFSEQKLEGRRKEPGIKIMTIVSFELHMSM